jgi:hypothetical protein
VEGKITVGAGITLTACRSPSTSAGRPSFVLAKNGKANNGDGNKLR